jgi:hypothetical protein
MSLDIPISKPYQNFPRLATVVCCLCFSSFYYGYTNTYVATIDFSIMKAVFYPDFNDQIQAYLIGVVPVGAAIGCYFGPLFMALFTRKYGW